LWQPAGREVTPLDPSAARLGSDAVPAPKRKAAPAKPAVAKKAVKKTAKKAVAKKAAPKKAASAKKAAPKKAASAKTAAPKKPVAKKAKVIRPRKVVKARAPRAVPTPAPEVEEGPFYAPAVIKLPVVPVAEPVEEVVEQAAAMVEEQQEAPAATGRRKGQRVPLPSWSDVLLGVTRDESRRSG
jgi:hypothetical protein